MQNDLHIRTAQLSDAGAISEIYAPYVRDTAISFEYEAPDASEMENRIRTIAARYPYLVACDGEQVVGYAYAGPFKTRKAYDISVEVTVYVRKGYARRGIGQALYKELESRLKAQHICNLYACIALPDTDNDPYLTTDSIEFHTHMGYRTAGTFRDCAVKFGRAYSMVWMEKRITDPVTQLPLH